MRNVKVKSIVSTIGIVFLCLNFNIAFGQNIAITDDDSYTANNSAILDVKSISKGLLIPRLTQAQRDAISTPAIGLMIYQTDNTPGIYYFNGTWKMLGLSSGDNLGNHIATQNIKLDTFWLSNDGDNEGIYIDTSGNVGIGTDIPLAKFTVSPNITSNSEVIGGLDVSYGLLHESVSGRSGFTTKIMNNWLGDGSTADAGFAFIFPFDGAFNDHKAFRLLRGSSLVDKFYVKSDGDAYFAGNVGVGTTNPLEKLTVDGNIRIQTGGTANLVFSAEIGYNSIFSYGGDHISLNTSGSVGIGTTTPSSKLTVAGSILGIHAETIFKMYDTGDWSKFILGNTNADNEGVSIYLNGYDGDAAGSDYAGITHYGTNAENYRLSIGNNLGPIALQETGGNVGIGLANPLSPLHIKQPGSVGILFDRDANSLMSISNAGAGLLFENQTAGTDIMIVRANGNVGVGTIDPPHKLSIQTNDNSLGFAHLYNGSTKVYTYVGSGNGLIGINDSAGNGKVRLNTNGSSYLIGGNIGIGTITPNGKLQVNENTDNGFVTDMVVGHGSVFNIFGNNNTYSYSTLVLSDAPDIFTESTRYWNFQYRKFVPDDQKLIIGYNTSSETSNSGTSIMTLQPDGKVGIGTLSPTSDLHIGNSTGERIVQIYGRLDGQNGITVGNSLNERWSIFQQNSAGNNRLDIYGVHNSGATRVTPLSILINGNVGIGSANPTSRFEVQAATADTVLFSVKDKDGNNVFIVYPDAVQVIVPTDPLKDSKTSKRGAFVVSGRGATKGETNFMDMTKENYLIGHNVATGITTGTKNSVLGYEAGQNLSSGYKNVLLGYQAGQSLTSGSQNVMIGEGAGTSGNLNFGVFVGYHAGYNTTASYNTFVGWLAAAGNTSGDHNVSIGSWAGANNTTGSENVYIGSLAAWSNNGSGNVIIGCDVAESMTGLNDVLMIDNHNSGANPLIYGNFSTHIFKINGSIQYTGTITDISDKRLKRDLVKLDNTLNKLNKITGFYYNWKTKEYPDMILSDNRQIGVIAQEVELEYPELVITDEKGYKSVDYIKFTPILIEAIKEQQKQLDEKDQEIKQLNDRLLAIEEYLQSQK